MERSPISAVVLSCTTCGFIRIADDHSAAHARAAAHMHLSGHQGMEYSIIESPDRLMLAQAFEQRSRKTVIGYVQDGADAPFDTFTGADGMEATIAESGVGRQMASPSLPCH
jgi:hypothetical protein